MITTTELIKRLGRNAEWEEPHPRLINAVQNFVTDLYINKPLNEHLRALNLEQLHITDVPGAVAYIPKDSKVPQLNQIFVLWNYSNDTFNFIASYQHSGTDNVDKLALAYFKNNFRYMVANGIQPRASTERSKLQPKRNAADGCHSYQVLAPHIIKHLMKLDPTVGLFSIHGCTSDKAYDIWFSNSCARKFNKNVPNIAYEMLKAYTSQKKNTVQTNDPTFKSNPRVIYKFYLPTSDVPMNIFNPERKDSGRAVHIEHTITMHSKTSEINSLMKVVAAALTAYELRSYRSIREQPTNEVEDSELFDGVSDEFDDAVNSTNYTPLDGSIFGS